MQNHPRFFISLQSRSLILLDGVSLELAELWKQNRCKAS